MLESLVDLTYRGISLSRRVKLTQVRPSSGYLELPAPMPVGSEIALVVDDGLTIAATVALVHEQVTGVAGSDRAAGMQVVPRLAAEAAAAWWQARVALPEHDAEARTSGAAGAPRDAVDGAPGARSRPVTVRPRTHTQPTTPPPAAPGDAPSIAADLAARVTAAAGVAVPGSPPASAPQASAVHEPPGGELDGDVARTDHVVIDDGAQTMIMRAVDPAVLEFEAGAPTDPGPPVLDGPDRDPERRAAIADREDAGGLAGEPGALSSGADRTDGRSR